MWAVLHVGMETDIHNPSLSKAKTQFIENLNLDDLNYSSPCLVNFYSVFRTSILCLIVGANCTKVRLWVKLIISASYGLFI
jgi:hypothetical protein